MLAKYKLPLFFFGDRLNPFTEAGPSFRISSSVTHFGFTAGGGVSTRWGALQIAPEVRYTRWQADPYGLVKSNGATLLVAFTF